VIAKVLAGGFAEPPQHVDSLVVQRIVKVAQALVGLDGSALSKTAGADSTRIRLTMA